MSTPHRTPAIESSPPLQGERVVFTGTLASMTHDKATALVAEYGGTAAASVTRQTTMLVVGEEGWPVESDGRPSQKLQQAEELNAMGLSIRVIGESDWLGLIGLSNRRDTVREYTPAMLSSLLGVPVRLIRRWERLGLIRAVRKIHRLPYFDYEEVNSVRRLSELLESGVSPKEIESSLSGLNAVVGPVERSLAQLKLLVRDARVVARDDHGLVRPSSGQRLFDFDPPAVPVDGNSPAALPLVAQTRTVEESPPVHWKAVEWFQEGCRLADDAALEDAVEAFRLALTSVDGVAAHLADASAVESDVSSPFAERNIKRNSSSPHPAEVNFYLAETLYRLGRREAAIERYYCAAELDPQYLEAWTQLGCLLAEDESVNAAIEAFQIALDLHSNYPDAHWHLGNLLASQDRTDEAAAHWAAYLELENSGPWAETARQRLEEFRPAIESPQPPAHEAT